MGRSASQRAQLPDPAARRGSKTAGFVAGVQTGEEMPPVACEGATHEQRTVGQRVGRGQRLGHTVKGGVQTSCGQVEVRARAGGAGRSARAVAGGGRPCGETCSRGAAKSTETTRRRHFVSRDARPLVALHVARLERTKGQSIRANSEPPSAEHVCGAVCRQSEGRGAFRQFLEMCGGCAP